jgi:hypothetical protein
MEKQEKIFFTIQFLISIHSFHTSIIFMIFYSFIPLLLFRYECEVLATAAVALATERVIS